MSGCDCLHSTRRPGKKPGPSVWTVPARPLADALERIVARESRSPHINQDHARHALCMRIGYTERHLWAWTHGERPGVNLETVDKVLTYSDLLWWEVWNEDTVRVPVLVVTVHGPQRKLQRGRRRVYRVKTRTIPYGDRGPDRAKLREIEALMTGKPVRRAAA
jgi:hypothetical protein